MKSQEKYVLVYKHSGEVLSELRSREFQATSLSTYDIILYILHYPIIQLKKKILNWIERTFKREETLYLLACNDKKAF